jgi:hypothetical protein
MPCATMSRLLNFQCFERASDDSSLRFLVEAIGRFAREPQLAQNSIFSDG